MGLTGCCGNGQVGDRGMAVLVGIQRQCHPRITQRHQPYQFAGEYGAITAGY